MPKFTYGEICRITNSAGFDPPIPYKVQEGSELHEGFLVKIPETELVMAVWRGDWGEDKENGRYGYAVELLIAKGKRYVEPKSPTAVYCGDKSKILDCLKKNMILFYGRANEKFSSYVVPTGSGAYDVFRRDHMEKEYAHPVWKGRSEMYVYDQSNGETYKLSCFYHWCDMLALYKGKELAGIIPHIDNECMDYDVGSKRFIVRGNSGYPWDFRDHWFFLLGADPNNADRIKKIVPKPPVRPEPENPRTMFIGDLAEFLHQTALILKIREQWAVSIPGGRMEPPIPSAQEIKDLLTKKTAETREVCDLFLNCYLSQFSKFWNYWNLYGTTYDEWKTVEKLLKGFRDGCPPPEKKPEPPKEKPVPKTVPPKRKAEPKARSSDPPSVPKKGMVSEVRVDGIVRASFSDPKKAVRYAKDLKKNGEKAQVYTKFY